MAEEPRGAILIRFNNYRDLNEPQKLLFNRLKQQGGLSIQRITQGGAPVNIPVRVLGVRGQKNGKLILTLQPLAYPNNLRPQDLIGEKNWDFLYHPSLFKPAPAQ
ncbi:MAG: hypothetical protein VKK59_00690 [Vampirovibrionales bacterium]|nr:hypothetical protein [Vampirovibrionales bacterium]